MIFYFQVTPVNIIVGSHVWVEDAAEAWIDGEVFKINGEEVHAHTTNGKTVSSYLTTHFVALFALGGSMSF